MTGPDLLDDQARPAAGAAGTASVSRPTEAEIGSGRLPRRVLQTAVVALPVAFLAVLAWTHRSMYFDGYLYLHVVQNVLAGHGPVVNSGQRVEAFTSPLWTAVLSVAGYVTPFPLTSLAVDLGILGTVTGLALATAASFRLVRRIAPGAFVLPVGALVFVAVAPVWSLASLGLETGLVFLWLGACLVILVRWAGEVGGVATRSGLVILGLGPLVRPELALGTVVFLGVVVFVDGRHGWRNRVAVVAWAFALPLVYEVFRMGYYGMVVANTAVAKEASTARPGQGIAYLTDFLSPYWLVVPAAALLAGAYLPLAAGLGSRDAGARDRAALVALPVAAALDAAYVVGMGGDYVHARLLMAPFFAVCAPVAVVPLARRFLVSLVVVPWAAVCALSLRSADDRPGSTSPFVVVTGRGHVGAGAGDWGAVRAQATWLVPSGTYLQEDPATAPQRLTGPPAPGLATPTVATYWAGQGPYELGTGVRVLDLLGLADPLAAHMELRRRGVFVGHEKPLPTPWILALMTAPGTSTTQIAVLQEQRPAQFTPLLAAATPRQLGVQTAWARAALACPTIHTLEFGPDRPLTFRAFVSDLSGAVSRTVVRVPPDPEVAYHRFCGPGTPASVRSAGG